MLLPCFCTSSALDADLEKFFYQSICLPIAQLWQHLGIGVTSRLFACTCFLLMDTDLFSFGFIWDIAIIVLL